MIIDMQDDFASGFIDKLAASYPVLSGHPQHAPGTLVKRAFKKAPQATDAASCIAYEP
jgi:hypothetical protein